MNWAQRINSSGSPTPFVCVFSSFFLFSKHDCLAGAPLSDCISNRLIAFWCKWNEDCLIQWNAIRFALFSCFLHNSNWTEKNKRHLCVVSKVIMWMNGVFKQRLFKEMTFWMDNIHIHMYNVCFLLDNQTINQTPLRSFVCFYIFWSFIVMFFLIAEIFFLSLSLWYFLCFVCRDMIELSDHQQLNS